MSAPGKGLGFINLKPNAVLPRPPLIAPITEPKPILQGLSTGAQSIKASSSRYCNEETTSYTYKPILVDNNEPFPKWEEVQKTFTPQEFGIVEEPSSLQNLIEGLFSTLPLFTNKGLEKCAVISSVSANIISLANTIYIFYKLDNLPTSVKVTNSLSLASSLIALSTSLFAVVSKVIPTLTIDRAKQVALDTHSELIATIAPKGEVFKSNNSAPWTIITALTSMASMLIALLAGTSAKFARAFVEKAKIMSASNTYKKTADDLIKTIANDILGIDLSGDRAYIDKLKELTLLAHKIAETPLYAFTIDGHLTKSLKTLNEDIVKYTDKTYANSAKSSVAKTYLTSLNTMKHTLLEKSQLIAQKNGTDDRQSCVGVLLTGQPALGKSSFCRFLAKEISSILGYKSSLYTLNKKDGYYRPYGLEDFGIFNELANTVQPDPSIADLNEIISSDAFNFEGADLATKSQPCVVKCAFLTANASTPNLTTTLVRSSAEAFFSRNVRIRVSDPKCEGRTGGNFHRKPDFSHLTLHLVYTSSLIDEEQKANMIPISVHTLILYLASLISHQEMEYIKRTVDTSEPMVANRLKYLDKLVTHINKANTDVGQFFVTRLQGPVNTGKTTLANQLAQRLCSESTPIKRLDNFSDRDTTPYIYIVDDKLNLSEDYVHYFGWINTIHPKSAVILCTNNIIERGSSYSCNPLKAAMGNIKQRRYKFTERNTPGIGIMPGLSRRLGFPGLVEIKSRTSSRQNNSFATQFCYTFGETNISTYEGISVSGDNILDYITSKYDKFASKSTITVHHTQLAPKEAVYHVNISSVSFESFAKTFSSIPNIVKAWSGFDKDTRINCDQNIVTKLKEALSTFNDLSPSISDTCDLSVIKYKIKRYAIAFAERCSNINMRLSIEGVILVSLIGNNLYELDLTDSVKVVSDPEFPEVRCFNINFETTWKKLAECLNTGIFSEELLKIPQDKRRDFLLYLDRNRDLLPYLRIELTDSVFQKQYLSLRNTTKFKDLCKNPIIITAAAIIGTLTAGTFIYKLAKMNKEEENYKPNGGTSFSEPDLDDPVLRKFTERYRRDFLQPEKRRAIVQEVKSAGYTEAFNEWEYQWRSNVYRETTIPLDKDEQVICKYLLSLFREKDHKSVVRFFQQVPAAFDIFCEKYFCGETKSNMVLSKDAIPQRKIYSIDTAASVIRPNVVKITTFSGFNYGICIKDRLIVTVSHGTIEINQRAIINDNGADYEATCLYLSRQRDLSLYHVDSKNWPAKKDISKHFADKKYLGDVNEAFFFRLFDNNTTTHFAQIDFVPEGIPFIDPNNSLYTPSKDLFKYRFLNVNTCTETFKDGDCGFPLVAINDKGFKIIAIHNGYSNRGTGCFSSVTKELIDEAYLSYPMYISNTDNYIDDEIFDSNISFSKEEYFDITEEPFLPVPDVAIPKSYVEALSVVKPSKLRNSSSKLPIKGYYPLLHFHTNPVNKSFYKPINPAFDFPQELLPSAITLEHVTDTSNLISDFNGNPQTLATQCSLFGYDISEGELSEEMLNLTDFFMSIEIKKFSEGRTGIKPRQLRLHEAINGFKDMRGIDMKTSVGPYIKMKYKVDTKRPLKDENILFRFNSEDNTYFINQDTKAGKELLIMTLAAKDLINEGQNLFVLAKDNAKVELLPAEKVRIGKVRLFSELDLYINLVLRIFFGYQTSRLFQEHTTGTWVMGINPYIDSTHMVRTLNNFNGNIIDTDYKNLDKYISKLLIHKFCSLMLYWCDESVQKAMSLTLSNMYHVTEGSVYPTVRGNASGSFVTTMLNCFVLEYVNTYTFIDKYYQNYNTLPSYKDFKEMTISRILGDDKVSKWSPELCMTFEDCRHNALKFGLQLTHAKAETTGNEISFCSRILFWDEKEQICYPALKQPSIYSHLYYSEDYPIEESIARINIALFEASMWDKIFFERVRGICMYKARKLNFEHLCEWYPYEKYRSTFVLYVRSESESPYLQVKANLSSNKNNNFQKLLISTFLNLEKTISNTKINMSNYVSQLFEHCQKNGILVQTTSDITDGFEADHVSLTYKLTMSGGQVLTYSARDKNIKQAKLRTARIALADLGVIGNSNIQRSEACVSSSSSNELSEIGEDSPIHQALNDLVRDKHIDNLKYSYVADSLVWTAEVRASEDPLRTVVCKLSKAQTAHANSAPSNVPIEPMTVNSAAQYQGIDRLPEANTTAQPVGMAPTMGPPGEALNATTELISTSSLNPIGAPNMLPVGAIGFDIKDLAYTTFLDRDIEVDITNESPSGTILFQIPYGVDTPYTNKYIKAYASMHERYAGAIHYRLTTIGNQLYSGAIGVAWYPRRIATTTVDISELQKYSWYAKGVQMPWTQDIILHDARQDKFWRKVSEDTGDLDERPHLVVFLFVSVKNPYDAPSTVRMRIASKLSTKGQPNPFEFSNPELPSSFATSSSGAGDSISSITPITEVYKHLLNFPGYVYTDGRTATKFKYTGGNASYFTTATTDLSYLGNALGSQTSGTKQTMFGSSFFNDRAALISAFPSLDSRIATTFAPANFQVGMKALNCGMSPNYFGRLLAKCPFTSGSTSSYNATSFDNCKNRINWVETYLQEVNDSVNVLSVLHSDIVTEVSSSTIGSDKFYCYTIGHFKVVTDRGVAIFSVFLCNYQANTSRKGPSYFTDDTTIIVNDTTALEFKMELPYLRVENNSSTLSPKLTVLPLGYNKLDITTLIPSIITVNAYTGPTATTDYTIGQDFNLYNLLPLDQCVQFDLIDTRSNNSVATVRYLQEYSMFVINKKFSAQADYKLLPVDAAYLGITKLQVLNRGLEFPLTDTTLWIDRVSVVSMKQANQLRDGEYRKIKKSIRATSNAAMFAMALGGGAMQGAGQGLNSMADRKFQQKMQQNSFTQQKDLFNMHSELQFGMQDKSFDFQKMMQQGQFQHNVEMAEIHRNNAIEVNREAQRAKMISGGMENRLHAMPGVSFA